MTRSAAEVDEVARASDLTSSAEVEQTCSWKRCALGCWRMAMSIAKPEILGLFGVGPRGAPARFARRWSRWHRFECRGGARAHVIDVGFRLTDGRMRRVTAEARAHLIDFGVRHDGPGRSHHSDARSTVAAHLRFAANVSSQPTIVVSASGTRLILAWSEADEIHYRESLVDGGWGSLQHLQLTEQFGHAKALAVLPVESRPTVSRNIHGCATTNSVGALPRVQSRARPRVSGSRAAKLSSRMRRSPPCSSARAR